MPLLVRGLTRGPVARLAVGVTAAVLAAGVVIAPLPAVAGAVPALADTGPAAAAPLAAVSIDRLTSRSVEAFVRAAFADFLGRPASVTDLVFWGPRIQAGTSDRRTLTQQLSGSGEWLSTVIATFYRDTLGREPDPAGLADWIRAAQAGAPIATIASQFYASDEYYRTVGRSDPETWVRALYRALLLREGEPGGVAAWTRLTATGTPRQAIAIGFYQSNEKVGLRIGSLYQSLLGRTADPTGLASWPAVVRAQGDLVLAASLADSVEYFERASGRFPADGIRAPWVEVVGTGTPASCTTAALAAAVIDGGVVEFDCGPAPATIVLSQTLVTCNTTTCRHGWQGGARVEHLVVDGAGLVTLSGGGARGILYANTCAESLGWLDSRCDVQTSPRVVLRNLSFADGNALGPPTGLPDVGGGGAVAMRGGTLVVEDSTFRDNRTVTAHSDWGGGAVRVFGQTATASITRCTFSGNRGANGGAVSSLHAPMLISGSLFSGNVATGSGASAGQGGNGGAVYVDGTSQDVRVVGSTLTGNHAPEGGPGIFYVSNSRTGALGIEGSTIVANTGGRFWTGPYRDLFYLGRTALPIVSGSTIE